MATTLPGSPYVESSDLVANYPAVSESLAERVDLVGVLPFASAAARTTALPTPTDGQYSYLQDTNSTEVYDGAAWVAAGIAPGLVHLNTTTFSAVSSVSINDVFTSSYENYLIMLTINAISADGNIQFRYRASGTDNTVNYYTAIGGVESNGTATSVADSNAAIGYIGRTDATKQYLTAIMQVYGPQLATKTGMNTVVNSFNNTSVFEGLAGGVVHDNAGQFDGITFIASLGTIGGTIRIYGYKNS